MSSTWELRDGRVLVVEDAESASLVGVARDLKSIEEKRAALQEVIDRLDKR